MFVDAAASGRRTLSSAASMARILACPDAGCGAASPSRMASARARLHQSAIARTARPRRISCVSGTSSYPTSISIWRLCALVRDERGQPAIAPARARLEPRAALLFAPLCQDAGNLFDSKYLRFRRRRLQALIEGAVARTIIRNAARRVELDRF